MNRIGHILVATDFSACSEEAIEFAADFAKRFGADLSIVHIYEIPSFAAGFGAAEIIAPMEESARRRLNRILASLPPDRPPARATLRFGMAADGILAEAGDVHADLIVLGTHGRTGLAHAFLGSVAERVVRLSPVPVLTVREGKAHNAKQRELHEAYT
jgi:nucleotide-binding universal stress UspA family protein